MNDDIWRDFYSTASSEIEWQEKRKAADAYLAQVKQFVRAVPVLTPEVIKMLDDAYLQVEKVHGERKEWLA